MVWRAMSLRWTYGARLPCFVFFILLSEIHGCWSLNSEGSALLHFRSKVEFDPSGALGNWNADERTPCMWQGVYCLDGKVHMLNLSGRGLEGLLAPELGNLSHLRVLELSKNQFSGTIPREFGQLTSLEMMDLSDNKLTGTVPDELQHLHSLKSLLLCKNGFEGNIPVEIGKLSLLTDLDFDKIPTPASAGLGCLNRKLRPCISQTVPKQSWRSNSFKSPTKRIMIRYLNLYQLFKSGSKLSHNHAEDGHTDLPDLSKSSVIRNGENQFNNMHRILVEESSNLAANPPNVAGPTQLDPAITLPSRSSGSFPSVPNKKKLSPSPSAAPASAPSPASAERHTTAATPAAERSENSLKLILLISVGVFLFIIAVVVFFLCRSRAAKKLGPWKTGLSGQLQKAFVTGVPKLNRDELETACEDFSNIISTYEGVATVYKGTLSSGVEIAVVSAAIGSAKDWSKRSDLIFRKKIDSLSRVNHKNFLNLIGYCEEDEPFTRMMVFEYAPNGTLSEHLHVKEVEHLDWNARMRIIMGAAYCLHHMHDLNPPMPHSNLISKEIHLTDDYAAKIADLGFWSELITKSKKPKENELVHSELPPPADVETNIHSFGAMLLEIISGKLPCTQEQGHLIHWAAQYLNDKSSISNLVDPTLQSYKDNELEVVCEVIRSCIQEDERGRPSTKEVIQKLRQEIDISPDAATPRLSPLWWAELEILSSEAP